LAPAQIFLRIGNEFGAAACATEIVGAAAVVGAMLCTVRIDRHTAHGVDRAVRGHTVVIVPMMLMLCCHACTLPAIPPGGI
jgi:hypothetical protein